MSYSAYIVRIQNVKKHSNADRLQTGVCLGSQVIVGTDYTEGELGIYFPVDGQLSTEFCQVNNLLRITDENGNNIGGYLEPDKRNIRALKLRGEISDGLFMRLGCLQTFGDIDTLREGDILTMFNGHALCKKYIPRVRQQANYGTGSKQRKHRIPKTNYPLFAEHVDTEQLMPNLREFKPGDIVTITLKMHGTSGRTAKTLCITKKWNWFRNLFRLGPKITESIEVVTGTRRCILTENYAGAGGGKTDRRKYHDYLAPRLLEGEEIFYEIVGWFDETPIMAPASNKKLNDKEFVKQYGDTTTFTYGCEKGSNDIYVYRMTYTAKDGTVIEYPTWYVQKRCEQMGLKTVPQLEQFIFTDADDLLKRVGRHVGGADPIGLTHVREGVVARIENRMTFKAYKHKNFEFKCLEGIVKDAATAPDIEEQEEIIKETQDETN